MSKKQLAALFFYGISIFFLGNSLMPLLPVYATKLGASSEIVGYYLSIVMIAIFTGTIVAGWLSDKLQQRKKLLVANGLTGIPVIWVMGQVTSIWLLTILTAILWFVGGMAFTLIMILTGLFSEKSKRGKTYGTISMSGPLGMILGGLISGPIVDRWDYPIMFTTVSLLWALSQLIIFFIEDKSEEQIPYGKISKRKPISSLGGMFFIIFFAGILSQVVFYIGRLGVSLIMNDLNYAAAAISSTATIGGAVILPVPLLVGWISDQVGRKRLLMLFYLIGSTGMFLLTVSVSLWQFWIAFALVSLLPGVNRAVGTALVTDLIQKELAGRGISLFSSSQFIAGTIGFAFTGYAVQYFGMKMVLITGGILPLIGTILLIPVKQKEKKEEVLQS